MILGYLGRFESATITANTVSFSIAEAKARAPCTPVSPPAFPTELQEETRIPTSLSRVADGRKSYC